MLSAPACREAPIPTGAFVVQLDARPNGFDPRFPAGDASAKIMGLIHAGLVNTDTATGAPELELAASIEQTDDRTYEITLRPDIFFHDGRPVRARDVEYTLTELDDEPVSSPLGEMARRIESFTIHDERRFTLRLVEPRASFLAELSMGIVPEHYCGGLAQCPDAPIGAGPFRWVSSRDDQVYVLASFDRYFAGAPSIEVLAFNVVQDDNARLLALLGGSADLAQNAVSPLMLPVVRDAKNLAVETSPSFKYTYLAFNLRRPVFKDVRVRRAIAHAIDRRSIVEHKYRGLATLSTGLLAPTHWAYEPEVATYEYDPERAAALLDEAGYPDPPGPAPRFSMELKVSSSKFRRALALLIAHQLARVGIEVRVRAYEWGTYFYDIKSGNFDVTTLQWPSVLEPSLYRWIFHSENIPGPENVSAGANRGAYASAEVDALLERATTAIETDERRAVYSAIQKVLARDLPYVSLWHEDNIAVVRRGTRGYYATPNARLEGLKSTVRAPRPSP